MFTDRDKRAACVIVSIFETSSKRGSPAKLAVLRDGAGWSYGLHQATHKSGSLEKVLRKYVEMGGACAAEAAALADRLRNRNNAFVSTMSRDSKGATFLKQIGLEPVMAQAQELVFSANYMEPALADCETFKFVQPLSLAVVYDSHIHGSFKRLRAVTNGQFAAPVSEEVWVKAYCRNRYDWLHGHGNPDLRNSAYRPESFLALIAKGNWALGTPFSVRNQFTVEERDLAQWGNP
jgi:chitosanase